MRFGIIGCGVIAPHHAWALAELGDQAQLVAVADMIGERAEALAHQYGCAAYTEMGDLLRRPDIDAVCICTPSGLHGEHAVAALEAGKHVVIEKPVEITLPAIDRIESAARAAGKWAGVILQHRWDLASRAVQDAVAGGQLGRVVTAACQLRWWRSQGYYDSGEWRGTWALDGGGCLMNQAIHTVDLLQWLVGPVAEVTAYTACLAHERIEVEDAAAAALRFENGALGIIQATTAAYPGLSARLEIHGDRGSAVIDDNRLTYFHTARSAADGDRGVEGSANQADQVIRRYEALGPDPASLSSYPHPSAAHREQLRAFIAAVRENRPPAVTVSEGRKAVEIVLAAYESACTGRPVRIGRRESPHVLS